MILWLVKSEWDGLPQDRKEAVSEVIAHIAVHLGPLWEGAWLSEPDRCDSCGCPFLRWEYGWMHQIGDTDHHLFACLDCVWPAATQPGVKLFRQDGNEQVPHELVKGLPRRGNSR